MAEAMDTDVAAAFDAGLAEGRAEGAKKLAAEVKRREAAEAVLGNLSLVLRGIPVRDMDELIAHWQQSKAEQEATYDH